MIKMTCCVVTKMAVHKSFRQIIKLSRKRKGSIAIEAATAFIFALLILIALLGSLISVIAADRSDWKAIHTVEDVGVLHNAMFAHKAIDLAAVITASSADFASKISGGFSTISSPVFGKYDDYGSIQLYFNYGFVLPGIANGDSIVLPLAGYQVSDGIDFKKETVYITRTGERYHEDGCFHLRKSKFGINIEEAKKRGYTPCKNCH